MKRLAVLLMFCLSPLLSLAGTNQCNPLAKDAFLISKDLGMLAVKPAQAKDCRVGLGKASAQVLTASGLIAAKSKLFAKRALDNSVLQLVELNSMNCIGSDVIFESESKLVSIANQL